MRTLGLTLLALLIVGLIAACTCTDDPRLRIISLSLMTLAAVMFLLGTIAEALRAASGTAILPPTGAQQAYGDDVCRRRGSEATDVFVDHMPRLDDTHIVGPRLVIRCAAKDGVTSGQVYWLSSEAGVPQR